MRIPRRPTLTLLLTATSLLSGCFHIPTREHPQEGKVDFRSLVGDARSAKPIRPLAISRPEVARILGPPDYTCDDGLTDGYVLRAYSGRYLGCFYNGTVDARWYRLRLRYGGKGLLQTYSLTQDETGAENGQSAQPEPK